MRTNKVLQIGLHKKASTPNELITDIATKRTVNDRLKKLEQEVVDLNLRVDSVTTSQEMIDINMDRVLDVIELPKDHNKSVAIILKQKGHKVKNIAEALGVHVSTVKRWTQGLEIIK
jgi:16S rRNA U516 pseudouridylate synthase RsuA-like enzyme